MPVPVAGGVATDVIAYSYPVAPVTVAQLACAEVCVTAEMPRGEGSVHVVASVVKEVVVQLE